MEDECLIRNRCIYTHFLFSRRHIVRTDVKYFDESPTREASWHISCAGTLFAAQDGIYAQQYRLYKKLDAMRQ